LGEGEAVVGAGAGGRVPYPYMFAVHHEEEKNFELSHHKKNGVVRYASPRPAGPCSE